MIEVVEDWMELYTDHVITEEELEDVFEVYLRSLPPKRAPRFRSGLYGKFNLETIPEEEVRLNFRFLREDIPRLMRALDIPSEILIPERGYRVPGIMGLCMALRRLAYPNRLSDLESLFGVAAPMISTVSNWVLNHVVQSKGHLLTDLKRIKWLNHRRLANYAQAISNRGAALNNCWGFIDGTARKICRPTIEQEAYYSGHKRFHCLKYQAVMSPDGIFVSLWGAYQGRRHDAGILTLSPLEEQLRTVCTDSTTNQKFVLYGDPAYATTDLLISPFPTNSSEPNAAAFNRKMSAVRQAVEWGFAKIVREFAFLDFSKNQKLLKQQLPTMFKAGTIIANCHTCLYGGQIPEYFGISPPTLETYLS